MSKRRKILYSPGYGAGWATWNDPSLFLFLTTYQPIIDYIEGGGTFSPDAGSELYLTDEKTQKTIINPDAHPLLLQLLQDAVTQGITTPEDGVVYICCLGARDLHVETVSGRFYINEYDGSESLVLEEDQEWY